MAKDHVSQVLSDAAAMRKRRAGYRDRERIVQLTAHEPYAQAWTKRDELRRKLSAVVAQIDAAPAENVNRSDKLSAEARHAIDGTEPPVPTVDLPKLRHERQVLERAIAIQDDAIVTHRTAAERIVRESARPTRRKALKALDAAAGSFLAAMQTMSDFDGALEDIDVGPYATPFSGSDTRLGVLQYRIELMEAMTTWREEFAQHQFEPGR